MARDNELCCLHKVIEAYKALPGSAKIIFDNAHIFNILSSAKPNTNSNNYPDFVFDDGGIEHFEVTSSKENRKGSAYKQENRRRLAESDSMIANKLKELEKSPFAPMTINTISVEDKYDNFSYEDFLLSLDRNIKNHLESVLKFGFHARLNIFLVEQQTARMVAERNTMRAVFYEIHKDKKALEIINQASKYLKYFIYVVADAIEVIDLSKIDNLMNSSIVYKNVEGGKLINEKLVVVINP